MNPAPGSKYTYNGDYTFDGKVDGDDDAIAQALYDPMAGGRTFATGDNNRDRVVDGDDDGAFAGLFYSNGVTYGSQL